MIEQIEELLVEVNSFNTSSKEEIENFRIKFNGKKGILNDFFEKFKEVPNDQKKEFGQKINTLKQAVNAKLEDLKNTSASSIILEKDDLTKPAFPLDLGSRHPINLVKNRIIEIFKSIGFAVADGPEIEDDWHNFSALNFAPEHPARDMQDTFFITSGDNPVVLRTHTSSVQVRSMESMNLPIRIVCPGRVFRNEAISARAHCIFHQVEGLYIDKEVSFADLKQAVLLFAREMFGEETQIRLRPSYFPFTEPSAEVDVSCNICGGEGCNICKGSGWLEIMGCGMVDPNVLEASGIDSKEYSGFAFGMGIERIAMLKWQVKDLRHYFENDIRFLKQFHSVV